MTMSPELERQTKIKRRIAAHYAKQPLRPHKATLEVFDINTGTFFDQTTGCDMPAYNLKLNKLEYVPTNWDLLCHRVLKNKSFNSAEVYNAYRAFVAIRWAMWYLEVAAWWNKLSALRRMLNKTDKKEQRRQSIGIPHSIEHSLTVELLSEELKAKKIKLDELDKEG